MFRSLRARGCVVRAVEPSGRDPHSLDRALRRHPLTCPAVLIGSTRSGEMRQVTLTMTRQSIAQKRPGRLAMVDGSHLYPMEHPVRTAAAIDRMIKQLARARSA